MRRCRCHLILIIGSLKIFRPLMQNNVNAICIFTGILCEMLGNKNGKFSDMIFFKYLRHTHTHTHAASAYYQFLSILKKYFQVTDIHLLHIHVLNLDSLITQTHFQS